MKPYIQENGKISGTRISVYDVYYWQVHGKSNEINMMINHLDEEELQVALVYIAENPERVEAVHQQIEERNARGNPPEVLAKLEQSRLKFEERVREIRERKGITKVVHVNAHGDSCGSPFREPCLCESCKALDKEWSEAMLESIKTAYQESRRAKARRQQAA